MINIDKYIDTVFDELRFCDLDLVSIKAWVWHKVRTNRPFTNRVVFEEKRKTCYCGFLIDFETRKKANVFGEIDFLGKMNSEALSLIESYKTWETVKGSKIELEKIDFQELAILAGMCDYFNFLDIETQRHISPIKDKKNSFNLRPSVTARQIKEIYEALTQYCIIECDFTQIEKLFCVDGFERYEQPIKVTANIKELAFAFDELLKKGIFANRQWKADFANANVFIKDGSILTSKNFSDAIGSVRFKEFSSPKELFFI